MLASVEPMVVLGSKLLQSVLLVPSGVVSVSRETTVLCSFHVVGCVDFAVQSVGRVVTHGGAPVISVLGSPGVSVANSDGVVFGVLVFSVVQMRSVFGLVVVSVK